MLAKLKRRIPGATDDALLTDLLDEAGAFIRSYTNRSVIPPDLEPAQIRLAVILYNRMGMEGESSHSEGSVTHIADALPPDLRHWLNFGRVARTPTAAAE